MHPGCIQSREYYSKIGRCAEESRLFVAKEGGRSWTYGGRMRQTQQVFETPAPKREERALLNAKTPRITGAWVDTPVPARVSNSPPSPSPPPPPPPQPPPPETEELPQPAKNIYPSYIDEQEDTFNLLRRRSQPLPVVKEEPMIEAQAQVPSHSQPERPSQPPPPLPVELNESHESQRNSGLVENRLRRRKQGNKRVLEKPKLAKSALEVVLEEDAGYMTEGTIASLRKLLDLSDDDKDDHKDLAARTTGVKAPERRGFTSFPNEVQGAGNAPARATSETTRDVKPRRPPPPIREEPVATENIAAPTTTTRTNTAPSSSDRAHARVAERRTTHSRRNDGGASSSSLRLWRRDSLSDTLHLTTFGWSVLALLVYLLIECFLSAHLYPRYSPMCDYGICAYRDAPKFPFMLPTLFCRWTGLSMVFAPVKTVVVVLYRFFAQLFGLWDGFVDEGTSYNHYLHQAHHHNQLYHQQPQPSPPPPPAASPPPQVHSHFQPMRDHPADPNLAVHLDFGMQQDEVV